MKLNLIKPAVLTFLLAAAYGCVSRSSSDNVEDPGKLTAEFYTVTSAFKMKAGHERKVESERLASAVHGILVMNGKRTEISPGVWEETFQTEDIISPLGEAELIRLIGEPDHRNSDSLSYIVKKYDAYEGPQADYLVIETRRGLVVGTGRATSLTYY